MQEDQKNNELFQVKRYTVHITTVYVMIAHSILNYLHFSMIGADNSNPNSSKSVESDSNEAIALIIVFFI